MMKSVWSVGLFMLCLLGGAQVRAQSVEKLISKQSAAAAAATTDAQPAAQRDREAKQRDKRAAHDAKWYYDLGLQYGRAKEYYEASKLFRRALMYRPDYEDAYFGLGQAYAYLGRWPEAIAAFEQALRLNPKDDEAYQALGEAYVKSRAATAAQPPDRPGVSAEHNGASNATRLAPTPVAPQTPAPLPQPHAAAAAVKISPPGIATGKPPVVLPAVPPAAAAAQTVAAAEPDALPAGENVSAVAAAPPVAAPAEGHARNEGPVGTYRVGPGDVLQIKLLNAPVRNQRMLYDVLKDGQLDYPLAGPPQQVVGLTTDEIAARLTASPMLRLVSEAAHVLVGVHEYASHVITINGLVNDPGEKVLQREAIPLYVVLAAAQPQPEAGQVRIVSAKTGPRTVAYDPSGGGAMSMLIYPGDEVTVEAAPGEFFTIKGLIRQPGRKRFHAGLTLTQAVLLAGGIKEIGMSTKTVKQAMTTDGLLGERHAWYKVVIARRDAQGRGTQTKYQLEEIKRGRTPDPTLRPDDELTVIY